MKYFSIVCALIFCASLVQAHEGHGLPGAAHWHANDALLMALVPLVAVVGAGLWLNRKN